MPPAPDPRITGLDEFLTMRSDFDGHFRTEIALDAIAGQEQTIPWKSITALVPGPGRHSFRIHYGMVWDNEEGVWVMRYGFSVAASGTTLSGNEQPTAEWDGTSMVPVAGAWVPGTSYIDKVKVARYDLVYGFTSLQQTAAGDTRLCEMPWRGEVYQLFTDNGGTGSNENRYSLQVCSIARVHGTDDGGFPGYRHGICLCIVRTDMYNVPQRRLNNKVSTNFDGKGADYGNLRPPA